MIHSRRSRFRYFYPRPPRGGRLCWPTPCRQPTLISIHALREEGDIAQAAFNGTLKLFLSTPSARRATVHRQRHGRCDDISIHALREEGDGRRPSGRSPEPISIHALREEGDESQPGALMDQYHFYPRPPRGGRPEPCKVVIYALIFLSTPSARRATMELLQRTMSRLISIHALREEGDPTATKPKYRL